MELGRRSKVDLGLAGATVCVHGGSKGIGRAAAECFAAEGAKVAVLAGDAAAIDEAVEQSVELGGEGILANTVSPGPRSSRLMHDVAYASLLHAGQKRHRGILHMSAPMAFGFDFVAGGYQCQEAAE
jgi:NAD(P)-dependent dehydrogenase (short-subunit alcohol dehydrogenase family)